VLPRPTLVGHRDFRIDVPVPIGIVIVLGELMVMTGSVTKMAYCLNWLKAEEWSCLEDGVYIAMTDLVARCGGNADPGADGCWMVAAIGLVTAANPAVDSPAYL